MSVAPRWTLVSTQADFNHLVELIYWPDAEIREVFCHPQLAAEEPDGANRSGGYDLTARILIWDCVRYFELVLDGAEDISLPFSRSVFLRGTVDELARVRFSFTGNAAECLSARVRYRTVEAPRGLWYRTPGLLPSPELDLPTAVACADPGWLIVDSVGAKVALTFERDHEERTVELDLVACRELLAALEAACSNIAS